MLLQFSALNGDLVITCVRSGLETVTGSQLHESSSRNTVHILYFPRNTQHFRDSTTFSDTAVLLWQSYMANCIIQHQDVLPTWGFYATAGQLGSNLNQLSAM